MKDRIYYMIFMVAIFLLSFGSVASADTDVWQIKAGALQGITSEGLSYSRIDTILENPSGDALWGLAPNGAWYEFVYINDDIEFFNQARMWYDLGSSNNFKASMIYLNHPQENTGVGFVYKPEHWNIDWLCDIDFSAWVMEGGEYTLAVDGKYEFALGYGVNAHMLAGLTSGFSQDYIDGRIGIYHNLEPDGSLYAEVGYEDRADTGYVYFGVGGKI